MWSPPLAAEDENLACGSKTTEQQKVLCVMTLSGVCSPSSVHFAAAGNTPID